MKAGVPDETSARVAAVYPVSGRAKALGVGLGCFLLGGLFTVAIASAAVENADTAGHIALFGALIAACLGATAGGAWMLRLGLARTPRLDVEPDRLVLHHGALLRRPLVIPRAQVRAIAIDDGQHGGRHARFPVWEDAAWDRPEDAEIAGFLWMRFDESPPGLLSPVPVIPNVALVLNAPLPLDEMRSGTRREPHAAVCLAVQRPSAARSALAGWDVRDLAVGDMHAMAAAAQRPVQAVVDPESADPAAPLAAAVALTVGFYALVAAVTVGLLALPVVYWATKGSFSLVGVGFVFAALAVARGAFPPRMPDRTVEPALHRPDHPALFALVDEVAAEGALPAPDAIVLRPAGSAFATEVRGRRVLGISLADLHGKTVDGLRATVAHELCHLGGGDTAVARWVFRTHVRLGWTLEKVEMGPVRWLFVRYAELFLRITRQHSRAIERRADEAAIAVAGRARASGLRDGARVQIAFDWYVDEAVAPALDAGFLPPLSEGFRRYLAQPRVVARLDEVMERLLLEETDVHALHPALRERIARAEAAPEPDRPDDRPALALLGDLSGLERDFLTPADSDRPLTPLGWDGIGLRLTIPRWTDAVERNARVLSKLDFADVADLAADLPAFSRRLGEPMGRQLADGERAARAGMTLAAAVACALLDCGWDLKAEPGSSGVLEHGGRHIEPFEAVRRLAQGTLPAEEWRATCAEAGVLELPLAAPGRDPSISWPAWQPQTRPASSS